jgi:transposase
MKSITNTHSNQTQTQAKFTLIKLGVDVHADSYRVVRQIDSPHPNRRRKCRRRSFCASCANKLRLAHEVHSCYEAGPFGYGLHRQLLEMGVQNVVVRPQNWDELGRKVKTDKTDALALVQRLDRYVQGNTKALAVIAVPTPEQEQLRAQSRQREQMQKTRQAHEAQGRSLLLYHGYRVQGHWWKTAAWERLQERLPSWLIDLLRNLRQLVACADELLEKATSEIEAQALAQPKAVGLLTSQTLQREVLDWHRFKNRRQVASLTGLCPSVHASGQHSLSGSITKHGNPRLRRALIELAWRVVRFQPRYGPVARWGPVLAKPYAGGRKKAIVAIARKLAIDLWRVQTGRCSLQDLQLV